MPLRAWLWFPPPSAAIEFCGTSIDALKPCWCLRSSPLARGVPTVSPTVRDHQERLIQATQQYIVTHLRKVRRVAEFNAYERLFSLWHKVHLPFFYLFVVSVVVHVVVRAAHRVAPREARQTAVAVDRVRASWPATRVDR